MNKFTIVESGYSKEEVNKFVDDVIAHTEGIIARVKSQHEEIERTKKELQHYKKIENDLKNSLYKAEEASSNTKKLALDERNSIIEDAKKDASRIVNDALLRAEKIELKTDMLERNLRIFKKKLRLVIEQQLTVVDEIEELDLN